MERKIITALVLIAASGAPASAQVDPLLFLKRSAPNVLVMVDTGNRMQRDAPTDPANPRTTSNYYDPFVYSRTGAAWEASLGITPLNTTSSYRRLYKTLVAQNNGSSDKFTAETLYAVTDTQFTNAPAGVVRTPAGSKYSLFEAPTRLSIARAALYQAIKENQNVARFGLYKMRQSSPTLATLGNSGPVAVADPFLQAPTDMNGVSGRWNISRPSVAAANGSLTAAQGAPVVVAADASGANTTILSTLLKDPHTAGGLLPAGQDDGNSIDEPVQYMLDDLKTEAVRLITADNTQAQCRNTVAVLITGGGEGNTASGADPASAASAFLTAAAGRHIPIIVIAIAPGSADVPQLQSIAANSGGQYFEISKAQIDAALTSPTPFASLVPGTVIVPEVVRALEIGVQTAFQRYTDLNTAAFWSGPWTTWAGYAGSSKIPSSEFQVTSPIVGTVNLENGHSLTGAALPYTIVYKGSTKLPQRSNLLVTSGFTLPGFDGMMRAFRVYAPTPDPTQVSGYKFVADGTPLWIARTPSDPVQRNLYTALADGTVVAFTTANAGTLAPLMNLSVSDTTTVIDYVRSQPLGAVVDSTPAIMNAPSLDPPPDDDYPAFAVANKDRRSIVWVGTNRGILEGIDARLGVEVWGFIPLNLLPKLKTLRDGQPVGSFDSFADGSPKIADVKIDGTWKTYMIVGEGPGGTFYQTFDVTLGNMVNAVSPDSDSLPSVLTYFSSPSTIPLKWEFPRYSAFDPTISPYGDVSQTGATAIEKTVGQTWSDPAVGQVVSTGSPYSVLVGSGFLPYSTQQRANRGGIVAGTTFYILNAKDGAVASTMDVSSDGKAENVDDCSVAATPCKQVKNALQSDPVATGPSDSRFITKAYLGDLDGNVWRFDIGLNASTPVIAAKTKLYSAGADQPIFSSMATVNVGGTRQYVFFGTGSDLLMTTDQNTQYHLLGVLDNGATGSKTMDYPLAKTASGGSVTADEKVTAFPAVAGDIVFFTTTTFKPSTPCSLPDAKLYAFTFIGGPAYDNTGDNKIGSTDTPLVKTVAGQRATAPFIVDQHLMFGSGTSLNTFGDPTDYNNGIGQAGVRILSWREVR